MAHYRCGTNDITVAREAFVSFLNDNEMAVADSGYAGEARHIKTPQRWHYLTGDQFRMAVVICVRDETVNDRLKGIKVLANTFRHSLVKHSSCFQAVAMIAQLNINNGSPLFQVEYVDEGWFI